MNIFKHFKNIIYTKTVIITVILGIILTAVAFIYTNGNTKIANKLLTSEHANNEQINKLAAEMINNPDLMLQVINKIDSINNTGAKKVLTICDSLTGIKDVHYMMYKMFFGKTD